MCLTATPRREVAHRLVSATSKQGLNREAALLRVKTRPEYHEGNLRKLTYIMRAAATAHTARAAVMAHIAWPRGATPHPRPGAEARRTPCPRGGSQEELPHVQGQGQWPRVPGCDGAGQSRGATPRLRSGGGSQEELPHVQGQGWRPRVQGCDRAGTTERSSPTSEVRGGNWEEQPHLQGVMAALVQEGLEELFNVQGQEGWW